MQTMLDRNHIHGSNLKRETSSVAVLTALISFSMLFATLMLGFSIFRFTAPVWPPQGMVRPDLLLPTLSTLSIILSSILFYMFEAKLKKDELNKTLLSAVLGCGFVFMGLQSLFWNSLKAHGIFVSSGLYPSILYAFTWIHAAHVFAAYFMLMWLMYKMNSVTKITEQEITRTENVGKFWHFLGVVWLIMFVTIFVL